jgi:SAM-dependent methyltransferase
MVDRLRVRGSVRNAVVWHNVRAALADLSSTLGRGRLDILDAGGGTGGFAVPLAELGHQVTVVDASPDSLAALERRAAEAAVTNQIRGLQGDAATLLEVVGAAEFDVAICHSVLEIVDDPAATLTAIAATVRSGGLVSVVTANAVAAVLHRAIAGRFDEALHALRDPLGRYAAGDPLPRRFSLPELQALVSSSGLSVVAVHGARVFADVVPPGLLDGDPQTVEALVTLELEAAQVPALRDIATALHVLARRE